MELIDKKEIYKFFNGGNGIATLHVADVDLIPAVDATQVVHGRWILRDNGTHMNVNTEKPMRFYLCDCSVCGYHTGTQAVNFNYCPKCGATMEDLSDDDIK